MNVADWHQAVVDVDNGSRQQPSQVSHYNGRIEAALSTFAQRVIALLTPHTVLLLATAAKPVYPVLMAHIHNA